MFEYNSGGTEGKPLFSFEDVVQAERRADRGELIKYSYSDKDYQMLKQNQRASQNHDIDEQIHQMASELQVRRDDTEGEEEEEVEE